MGAIIAFIYANARKLIAWGIVTGAITATLVSLYSSRAWTLITTTLDKIPRLWTQCMTAAPTAITSVSNAIADVADESGGWFNWMLWAIDGEGLGKLIAFLTSSIWSLVVLCGSVVVASLAIVPIFWTVRKSILLAYFIIGHAQ